MDAVAVDVDGVNPLEVYETARQLVAHLRTILDDNGRPMMFINWNTDMGDGWEWSNAQDYPEYIKYTSMAYRMGINEIIYAGEGVTASVAVSRTPAGVPGPRPCRTRKPVMRIKSALPGRVRG